MQSSLGADAISWVDNYPSGSFNLGEELKIPDALLHQTAQLTAQSRGMAIINTGTTGTEPQLDVEAFWGGRGRRAVKDNMDLICILFLGLIFLIFFNVG